MYKLCNDDVQVEQAMSNFEFFFEKFLSAFVKNVTLIDTSALVWLSWATWNAYKNCDHL